MPSIADLVASERKTVLELKAGELAVTYKPAEITGAKDAEARRKAEDGDESALSILLCDVLTEWDLTGPLSGPNEDGERAEVVADGAPVPLTPEALRYLPFGFLQEVVTALIRDQVADPTPSSRRRRST